ncbi:MAG: hypothetical protein MJ225_04650 [Bacilli bacterium]|nr:hypothetical protein [Bacilli bacterium]
MNKNILLIVEGSRSEQNIFSNVFLKYGFNTIVSDEKMDIEGIGKFDKFQYELNKNNIVIIQGPRNRIHDFLNLYNENEMSIEKFFNYTYAFFHAIFLIYDVDHNDCEDVEEMFNRFSDETTGMLLLSSPCIEVIADYNHNRGESRYCHLEEYKADINTHYNGQTMSLISKSFNELMLYYLDKNFNEFHESNVMEHPGIIVSYINKYNDRINCKNKDDSYVIYRYFSTVVYVAIAYANGLTKEIDNYMRVRSFLSDNVK